MSLLSVCFCFVLSSLHFDFTPRVPSVFIAVLCPAMSRSRSRSRHRSRRWSKGFPFRLLSPENSRGLMKLRDVLKSIEEKTQQKMEAENEERLRELWYEQKCLMRSEVRQQLSEICQVPYEFCEPAEIARDLKCCVLQARSVHGRDVETQNKEYSLQNHKDMISDEVRVNAFWEAIERNARNEKVLDVGTGAFCFLSRMALTAGAKEVYAVEVNDSAWRHAVQLCSAEVRQKKTDDLEAVQRFPLVSPGIYANEELKEEVYRISLSKTESQQEQHLVLQLKDASTFCDTDATKGPFGLVIHELLGHVASSEGVCETMAVLFDRRIRSDVTRVIPRAAGTLFAPTSPVHLTDLEKVINASFNGELGIRTQVKYHARCFDSIHFLAQPQTFEWLDFQQSNFQNPCKRRVTFVTEREGYFDGLHFHLLVELDEVASIDTLKNPDTTWSTTYVRLLEDGIWLSAGTRIVCDCESKTEQKVLRCFSVKVYIGEPWEEREVTSFYWEGCT